MAQSRPYIQSDATTAIGTYNQTKPNPYPSPRPRCQPFFTSTRKRRLDHSTIPPLPLPLPHPEHSHPQSRITNPPRNRNPFQSELSLSTSHKMHKTRASSVLLKHRQNHHSSTRRPPVQPQPPCRPPGPRNRNRNRNSERPHAESQSPPEAGLGDPVVAVWAAVLRRGGRRRWRWSYYGCG